MAGAGEITKDAEYLDIVNDSGGDFIPLASETFGVWYTLLCEERFASQVSKTPVSYSTFSNFVEVQCEDDISPILPKC